MKKAECCENCVFIKSTFIGDYRCVLHKKDTNRAYTCNDFFKHIGFKCSDRVLQLYEQKEENQELMWHFINAANSLQRLEFQKNLIFDFKENLISDTIDFKDNLPISSTVNKMTNILEIEIKEARDYINRILNKTIEIDNFLEAKNGDGGGI